MPGPALRRIALLPWGDLIEDFLDSIGLSFTAFRDEMTGGWLFGYIEALKCVGVETTIFCVSARVSKVERHIHRPTGASLCVLPVCAIYRKLRRLNQHPTGNSAVLKLKRLAYHVAPYFATPILLLRKELTRARCDLILCQDYENPRFDWCVALGGLIRIPVFATFQGGVNQFSRFERLFRAHSMNYASGLIIGSKSESARVRRSYPLAKAPIAAIFNPLDLSTWFPENRNESREAIRIPLNSRVVVWHGRVDLSRKGLDVLLETWREVLQRPHEGDFLLLLIGTGSDSAALDVLIKAFPAGRVIWHNAYIVDRTLMRRYLSAGNLYAFPSRHEGFPVAPLEAMACCLPVIAAANHGVTDIFEEGEISGGILVPQNNPARFSEALIDLLENPERCSMLGLRAREHVKSAFALETVGKQLFDHLSGDTS